MIIRGIREVKPKNNFNVYFNKNVNMYNIFNYKIETFSFFFFFFNLRFS